MHRVPGRHLERDRGSAVNLEKIKQTPLGRKWLAVFVRLVWERSLTKAQQRLLLSAERVGGKLVLDAHRLARAGAVGANPDILDMEALALIEFDWRRFKRLTPLGVEVYLYGRRARQQAPVKVVTAETAIGLLRELSGKPGTGRLRRAGIRGLEREGGRRAARGEKQ